MKSERLLRNLNDIDGKYILEANPIEVAQHISRKKITALILAAALALFLVSCGVVAVIYGDSIQSWFGFYWHRITGQDMEVEQTAIIDHLSQDIGISSTRGEVTVSMEAARLGYGKELYFPTEQSKQYFTTGEYIRKVEELAGKGLISNGKREELLMDAYRADIVYDFGEEEASLND